MAHPPIPLLGLGSGGCEAKVTAILCRIALVFLLLLSPFVVCDDFGWDVQVLDSNAPLLHVLWEWEAPSRAFLHPTVPIHLFRVASIIVAS